MIKRRNILKHTKRVVVKIGTSSITHNNSLNFKLIDSIAQQVDELNKRGIQVAIVTSGAVGCGINKLSLNRPLHTCKLKQAAAAVGQPNLMLAYSNAFAKYGKKVAQVLLTYDDFQDWKKYLSLKNTFEKLLELNVVPIINENDVTAADNIGKTLGGNDILSALVATKLDANVLINLTSVDGLLDKDCKLIKVVRKITKNIKRVCGKPSCGGTGGMKAKIQAAEICQKGCCFMIIANSRIKNVLLKILSGSDIGTIFLPQKKICKKKIWINFVEAKGKIFVDEGAYRAILNNKSLLPVGINAVEGDFKKNDVVDILFEKKRFAKGIVDYSITELEQAKGKKNMKPAIKTESLIK